MGKSRPQYAGECAKFNFKNLRCRNNCNSAEKLELFPPRAFGYNRSRESFKSNTGVAFDALGAPLTSANLSLSLLLHPERMARLVQQKHWIKNNWDRKKFWGN